MNRSAVVKEVVAAALLQLTFKHQRAVKVQLNIPSTNIKILKEKESYILPVYMDMINSLHTI